MIVGIDYSYTCPSLCLLSSSDIHWHIHYKKDGKSYPALPHVSATHTSCTAEIPRYIELANWVVSIVRTHNPTKIVLEDYAFGANGRLTQLSENAGTLKVKLFENFSDIPLYIVAPTRIKKFATGKGNATKDEVWAAFVQQYPDASPWPSLCHPKATKIGSPLGDIADSYFMAKYGELYYA